MKNVVFTVVTKKFLRRAIIRRELFLSNNPDCEFVICVADKIETKQELDFYQQKTSDGVSLLNFEGIRNKFPDLKLEQLFFRYNSSEITTMIIPFFVEYFFAQGFGKVFFVASGGPVELSLEIVSTFLDEYSIFIAQKFREANIVDSSESECSLFNLIAVDEFSSLEFAGFTNLERTNKIIKMWQSIVFGESSNIHSYNPQFTAKRVDFESGSVRLYVARGSDLASLVFLDIPLSVAKPQSCISIVPRKDRTTPLQSLPPGSIWKAVESGLLNQFTESFKKENVDTDGDAYAQYYYGRLSHFSLTLPDSIRSLVSSDPSFNVYDNPFLPGSDFLFFLQNKLKAIKSKAGVRTEGFLINQDEIENILKFDSAESKLVDEPGINIIGYLRNNVGVGEVARHFSKKVFKLGIPYTISDVYSPNHSVIEREDARAFGFNESAVLTKQTTIAFVNADVFDLVKKYRPVSPTGKKFAVWWWEFSENFNFPTAYDLVDGVICYSNHVYQAVNGAAPQGKIILQQKYPFIPEVFDQVKNLNVLGRYNVPAGKFRILYQFDFASYIERKNPIGLITVVKRLIDSNRDVHLILKIARMDWNQSDKARFLEALKSISSEHISIIDADLTRAEMNSLFVESDVYCSLHRSEGLGLGMLEAMACGTPLVATNFSGNTDYMNSLNSVPINFSSCLVTENWGPYRKGWAWAQPDLDHAYTELSRLYDDSEWRKKIAMAGYDSVRQQFSDAVFASDILQLYKYN